MIQIQLPSDALSETTRSTLRGVQALVNKAGDFKAQQSMAVSKWNSRPKRAFNEIKNQLIAANVGVQLCNYCEHNESADVEHIFPKKLYPGKTFDWENYLLACEHCNSRLKADQFAVFDPTGSEQVTFYERRGVYERPVSEDGAFLNPRQLDPMQYMFLNLKRGVFVPHPNENHARGNHLFECTERILELNKRSSLIEYRAQAAIEYTDLLKKYGGAKAAQTKEELIYILSFPEDVDFSGPFEAIKTQYLTALRLRHRKKHHPTVWREMVRQKDLHPELKALFDAAPEALEW